MKMILITGQFIKFNNFKLMIETLLPDIIIWNCYRKNRKEKYMWKIIDYLTKYFDEMLNMTIEYYGSDNDISNKEFIKHEYFENPFGDAFVKIAYDFENDKMAGQYIVLPRDYLINGHTYKSVLSLNTLTSEAYRGQKVFTKLADAVYDECTERGVTFCYGMPNQNSFPGFIKKLAFKKLGDVPLFLKIRNPFYVLLDKLKISYSYSNSIKSEGCKKENMELIEINKDNISYFDNFWNEIQSKYSVIGCRNSNYIKWRYLEMPCRDYTIYMVKKDGKVSGFVVGRITEVAGMRCGMIVDFLFKKNENDVGQLLLDRITKYFKEAKIGLLGCLMGKQTEEGKLLKKNGYFVCPERLLPQPFPIIFRQFNTLQDNDEEFIIDFSNWFFAMGDYDVI